jgi:hypothetical protein
MDGAGTTARCQILCGSVSACSSYDLGYLAELDVPHTPQIRHVSSRFFFSCFVGRSPMVDTTYNIKSLPTLSVLFVMVASCLCSTDSTPPVHKTYAYRVKNCRLQFFFHCLSCSHRSVFSSHTKPTIKSVTLPLRTRTPCTKLQWQTTLTVRLMFITHITSRFLLVGTFHLRHSSHSQRCRLGYSLYPAHLSTSRSLVSSTTLKLT